MSDWYDPSTWFSSTPSFDYTYGGTQFSDNLTSNLTPEAYSSWLGSSEGYNYDPYNTFLDMGGWGSTPYNTQPTSTSWFDKAYSDLGGLKGTLSLGLGGLSLLGNYLASSNAQDLAEDRLKQETALARQKLALEREAMNLGRDTDLAKVDAMMRLVKERQGVGALDPRRYAQIVASGQIPPDMLASQGIVDIGEQRQMADGGYYAHGGESQQGALSLLRGASGGQADDVNARLSHGEYVMDAESVSALGDGNTEAGARKLDQMRQNLRKHKRSAPVNKIPPKAKSPEKYMKGR